MEVSEAKRLKAREDENARLKKLLADATLDNSLLKDVLEKTGDAPRLAEGRGLAGVREGHQPAPGPQGRGPASVGGTVSVPEAE